MATYTPNQHGPAQFGNAYADIIASDGTNVHVIRTITLVNTDTVSHTVFITAGAGAAATEIYETASILANSTTVLNGWWILPVSTAMQGKADTAAKVTYTLSGYHYV
jgi:hypothetical protein